MGYNRVIPRDLFNEAKLLKCLGQFAIESEGVPEISITLIDEDGGFLIEQDDSSGNLFCSSLEILIGGCAVAVECVYNSKDPYPLLFSETQERVFDEDGSFSQVFYDTYEVWGG